MKKLLLSAFVAAAAAVPAFAGLNNLNYQAVIKDGGNVVADKEVALKFELLDKAEKAVYTEEQTAKTNASGYVACQIGKDDELSTIEWGDLTLRVSIKLGSDYEVISNEAVSSVPTALYALKSAETDALIQQIDDFATMVENRFDKIQNQADVSDQTLEELISENEETKTRLMNMGAEIARIDGLAGDVETLSEIVMGIINPEDPEGGLAGQLAEIGNAVEGLIADNEKTQSSIMQINAEIARIDGLAGDIEELNEQTDAMATMIETRIDKVQNQVDAADKAAEDLTEQIDAMATMTETRIDKVQTQLDETDKDVEGLKNQVKSLEEAVAGMMDDEDPDSLLGRMAEYMGALQQQIDALQEAIDALKAAK